MSSIERLQQAIDNTKGKTPPEVISAFLPQNKKIGEFKLYDVTYGHCLVLENLNHPLVENRNCDWTATDLGVALFVFTRPSNVLHELIKEEKFEDELYEFLNQIPASKYRDFAQDIVFHYYGAMSNVVEMESKGKSSQKKTLLGGFLAALRRFVGNILGHQTT